jgi:hypothetical protein
MWNVNQTPEFQNWFDELELKRQNDIASHIELLSMFGPQLKRPYADTLKGSRLTNLKELRFRSGDAVMRIFYIFDPERNAVLLIGGDKSGSGDKMFYEKMIDLSEKIYARYLALFAKAKNEKK